ncbi:hypothetical protein KIH74_22720 [Kineosporia sp. J2-2]|uniref:TrbL/VirB6 plasmid conjugal transfer protein n=1 Tax=Kineosporia corallincola TaxID=2835133 RepID=A0ABS5TL01_9ACTN|nr:hypothetical protein [Kineosporia corallincola]MBT0771772.1 hypothetical protein [Kineosporia corallincola]
MMRRIAASFAVTVAALLSTLIVAAPAQAAEKSLDPKCALSPQACLVEGVVDGDGCDGPPPAAPDMGVSSWLVRDPDPIPPAVGAFGPDAETTIYEQYGTGWARWRTCDLNPAWMTDSIAVQSQADNSMGTWILSIPSFLTSVYAAVITVAMDPGSWLGWLRPVLVGITDGLQDGLTTPAVRVALLAAGLMLLWHARKQALHKALGVLLMVVVVGAGITLITTDPYRWVEDGTGATADVVAGVTASTEASDSNDGSSKDPATQATSRVVDVILYRPWLQGMFGSSDSATAEKYGPLLLNAGSLRWSEVQEIRDNPDKAKEIAETHQKAWKSIMGSLEKEDPAAYEYATGRDGANRTPAALRSLIAMLCVLPILLVGAIVILAVGPQLLWSTVHLLVVLPLAILPSQTAASHVRAPLKAALAAVVNAVAMGVAMAVQLLAMAVLFDEGSRVPEWLALLLACLLTIFMWRATRAHRQVAAAPMRWAWRGTKAGVGLGVAAATGGWGAIAEAAARQRADEPETDEPKPADDSAHAERAPLAIEAGELPAQREERLLMESEVLAAKARLTNIPRPRTPGYEAPTGPLLTSVPGETHWTPPTETSSETTPVAGRSVTDEALADAQDGTPRQEEYVSAGSAPMTYDDGGITATVWSPGTGEMSLEDSYSAVASPAVEVEPPRSGFVPVEKRTIRLDGDQ